MFPAVRRGSCRVTPSASRDTRQTTCRCCTSTTSWKPRRSPAGTPLRVYVVTSDGVEHLVATNNFDLASADGDDEFDDPDPIANPAYADPDDPTRPDDIDTDVQRLFNTTVGNDAWRQARVPLGEFAGRSGLSLRIEFSTSGTTLTMSESIRVISGRALSRLAIASS